MKKVIIILLAILILIPIFVMATNQDNTIDVLIENKQIPQKQMRTMSLFSEQIQKPKYEIKRVTLKEFEELKKDSSVLVQKEIKRTILMDISVPIIGADATWELQQNLINITGSGQTVCILDTGAQTDHPSLIGQNATCNIDCATAACIEDCSKTDLNGHGTHVAGTIVSTHVTYHGVTQNTKYIPVMVCNSAGNCDGDWVLDGIDWCVANRDIYNISVISMSLGGGQYDSYCDISFPLDTTAINNAVANNITVVTATGNRVTNSKTLNITNHSAGISNPACIQNSLRVGNTDDSDNMAFSGLRGNLFSDIITAPGVGIMSTWQGSNRGDGSCIGSSYCSLSGTSMSTPHISGIITLLNQYKKLESNTILTPSSIKKILKDSAKTVYDSDTDNDYYRVNIYNAILASDNQPPKTNLITPINSLLTEPGNQTFQCNATDNLQLSNLTLNIYNSTELIFTKTNYSNIKSLSINISYNLSNIDSYNWNCISSDNISNYKQTTNRTISTSSIKTQIKSPIEYINQNKSSFNCSSQSTRELTNISFNIYNKTSIIFNNTRLVSGLNNHSIFNFTLPNETTYTYNCISNNNNSQTSLTENYTITYDKTSPQITLSSPINSLRTTIKTNTFTYSETELNKNICNLTINSQKYNSFTQTLSDGAYYWNITCTDLANNINISKTRLLTIYTASSSSGGGGGGGSSRPSFKTYTPKDIEVEKGYSEELKEKDRIKFKSNSNNHELILNKISTNKVEITIKSEPITILLYTNSTQKINLDHDNTFDIEVTLLSTTSRYADIKIKTISEDIPVKTIQVPNNNNSKDTPIYRTENNSKEIELLEENNRLLRIIIKILRTIADFFNMIF